MYSMLAPILMLSACADGADKLSPATDSGPAHSGLTGETGDSDTPPTQAIMALEMQQICPLIGLDEAQAVEVTLSETADLLAEGWSTVDIALVATANDGSARELARVDGVSLADGAVVAVDWTPSETGIAALSARATLSGYAVGESEPWRIAVTPTRVYVHHWAADLDDNHWVSALIAPSAFGGDTADDETWRARGAQPLLWKGDDWATDDPVAYAVYLADGVTEPATGIVLDELLDGSAHDQIVSQALSLVREAHPELYMTPYLQLAAGDAMIAALSVSDLALVEVFPNDFRSYEGFGERLQQAIDVGLEDHALPVLSLYEASNEAELRQQVLYFRTHYPDLPGIGFFGSPASAALSAVMDDIIEEAYLAPALTVETSDHAAAVRNIGGDTAEDVVVRFLARDGSVADEFDLGEIAAGDIRAVATVEDFETVELSAAEGVTLLVWTDPRELVPDGVAAETWWDALVDGGSEESLLTSRPELVAEYDGGLITGATLPLGSSSSHAVELDFELVGATIYGSVGVGVRSDDASLLLSFYQGGYDTDLASNELRATLTWTGPDGGLVTALVPAALAPGRYTLRLAYDDASVRALILDRSGALVGDTGALAIDGPFAPDTFVFDVRDEGPSDIYWDSSGDERIWLYGGVGSYFYVYGWISDISVFGS